MMPKGEHSKLLCDHCGMPAQVDMETHQVVCSDCGYVDVSDNVKQGSSSEFDSYEERGWIG